MLKLLFVCHGNICRSPMAEFVMKDIVRKNGLSDEIYVESCATSTEEIGNDIHYGTKRKLTEMGIPFEKRGARQITKKDYENFDYIILMDSYNVRNLKRIIPDDTKNKVFKLLDFSERKGEDIADPWYTGNFDETYNDVLEGCNGLLLKLKSEIY
ncbi:MAG: low molecular weight phosphotyrosine protein phosphatase [Oscillospiraceae bacterium]|nr:low molecular weight phosphotyrosine protein phosphatase [Oscillospiraceae bacterium]